MTMTVDLQQSITDSQSPFGSFGAAHPIFLSPPSDLETVSCVDYLRADSLLAAFESAGTFYSGNSATAVDLRAGASRLMRRYCGSIATASLVPLASGVALDVSLERCSVVIQNGLPLGTCIDLDGSDLVVSAERATAWPVKGRQVPTTEALREVAFRWLFGGHLAPAFERVLEVVHVARRLLWCTAAEQIDALYESAVNADGELDPNVYARDREAILADESLPGVIGKNPMLGLLWWESAPDFPRPLMVRKVCCVCMVMPGRPGTYCRSCSLISREARLDLWRRYRDGKLG